MQQDQRHSHISSGHMKTTWHLWGTIWTLGHRLGQLGDHLASFENCMNNTWAQIGTMETTSEQLGDNFGTTWRKLCDNFETTFRQL